jgi:IMP dehydrogenase
LAVALAQCGGLAFIHQNQAIEEQARDVWTVKRHRAGFRTSEVSVTPSATLGEVARLLTEVDQGVAVVTDTGTTDGRFLGVIGLDDFNRDRHGNSAAVTTRMRPRAGLVTAPTSVTLSEANEIIWAQRLDV